jgi:DNA-binding CsgD family transcriptional regulator
LCPVLIGRDSEARQLRVALQDAQAGRGSMVLVAGEPGIGKSRLVREIAEAARQRGCVVMTGRAVGGGVPTPFRPFSEALASALRPGGLPESTDLNPFLPALGRLVPHLRAESAGADGSLVFLGEAVLRLLRLLAAEYGCLLVLEDLHWADQETLALAEYLADNLSAERVLCLGTFRPGEGGEVAELAAKLEVRGSAQVLSLTRLDPGAVAAMALACLGSGELPEPAQAFVAEQSDGLPFLVEELLASLIKDGVLAERDGRWETTGPMTARVPAGFAGAVARRMDSLDRDARLAITAAAVLGRRFEWSLLGSMTGLDDETVTQALRSGVDLQLIAAGHSEFRFRHALTHEAVLAVLLPPERASLAGQALSAVQAAHPGLPNTWCATAADLAERSGDARRAGELLLEAGGRDLAVGALASAEQTLTRAKALTGTGNTELEADIDEALTKVFAASGQVDLAIDTGRGLLARSDTLAPARAAKLHLLIAHAAIAGGRWADAEASLQAARRLPHPQMSRVDVCAARLAEGQDRYEEAVTVARAALQAAEAAGLPHVQCEALEVIGQVMARRDLDESERAFSQAASIAVAHGVRRWHVRALAGLGTVDTLRTGSLDRLTQAREFAVAQGALFLIALIDLQIAATLLKQFRADEALEVASQCAAASRRFRLFTLPEALIFEAAGHAARGERAEMEARIAEAIELAPADVHVRASADGRCRATLALLDEDMERAWAHLDAGAGLLIGKADAPAAPFLGLWPLLGAVLGRDAASAAARVVSAHMTSHHLVACLLGYTSAILAGQAGKAADAEAAFAAADAQLGPLLAWYRQYARRLCAQAALADGWGDPVAWLREAAAYFQARGDDRIAAACRRLLRAAGATVPRPRPGDAALPERLRALGVTGQEAEVLRLLTGGLTNREIAERMFLSPRTVEKHVASLLVKTGVRRRAQLAGYLGGPDQ